MQEIGREMGVVEKYDHKNIRRRVYDALNVLMAIDIIRKDKKEIRWLGLPSDASHDLKLLEAERMAMEKRVMEKRRVVSELVQRHLALKALICRNLRRHNEEEDEEDVVAIASGGRATKARLIMPENGGGGGALPPPNDRLPLPFILVNAPKDCRVHCEMLEDRYSLTLSPYLCNTLTHTHVAYICRTQYFFEFDAPFFINEDIELLKLMGLDAATADEASEWLPAELVQYAPHRKSTLGRKTGVVAGKSKFGSHNHHPGGIRRTLLSSPGGHQSHHHHQMDYYGGLNRPPPHLMPFPGNGGRTTRPTGPMSDITCMLHHGVGPSGTSNSLNRRLRETLFGITADSNSNNNNNNLGSSPVI